MTARQGLSLRARVLIGLGAIAAIAIAVAGVVTATTHTYLMDQLDERLATYSGPGDSNPRPRLVDPDDMAEEYSRPSEAWQAIYATDGTQWVRFVPNTTGSSVAGPELTVDDFPESGTTYFTAASSDGETEWRVMVQAATNGAVATALPLDGVTATTQRLILIEGLGILGILAALGAVGWWVIRLGVSPMRRMVHASAKIAEGDLDVRLEGAGRGSESAELAHSLNTMIGTLTASIEERERSEKQLREFVADASHELRTPLTTVLGYAELYRRGAIRRDEDVADAWSRTEAEASRMRRLVEDMLMLARFDAEPSLNSAPIELSALCREVVADATAARPGTEFALEAPAPVTALADPDRLRQAVINVVTNAAVHGGPHVTVHVSQDDSRAHVRVVDDGPGMPAEIAARATDRFVRGDTSRARSTGGAGLGLAITSAIVSAHAGDLTVASIEGEGTTVSISLPLAPA
ncbi:sensor histidine kinase [Demequina pelophila]|uniref:sensor histidine kinase n=1 Tax=Demequina pelophila TaxID=1638984 RepID=UPI000781C7D3|nr:HAMP domain-containing sensor histidine kinase [Demequina pelophila]